MKLLQWYHVLNFSNIDNRYGYGFAVDERGIVCNANEKVNWMVGRKIEDIEKFFEGKPCILSQIKINNNE